MQICLYGVLAFFGFFCMSEDFGSVVFILTSRIQINIKDDPDQFPFSGFPIFPNLLVRFDNVL